MGSRPRGGPRASENDGASPGKIFIGGLAKDTTTATFLKHFGKYGEIIDSVIMKDRMTGNPRGFGFITYSDPSVVDQVIADNHVINGKQVEIKRTIPKGGAQSKDFKTKKIFVGGIPTTVTEDELKDFFLKHGRVVEHQIIRDHASNRSRGFGFVIFDNEDDVDNILVNGNMIDFAGTKVEIKKAEPKKASNPPKSAFGSDYRGRSYDDGYGGFDDSYSSFGGGGGYGPHRTGGLGGRLGGYGGYGGGGELGSAYGGYGGGNLGAGGGSGYGGFSGGGGGLGGYRGESSLGYSGHLGSYGGGYGSGGYGGGYGGGGYGGGLGGYGRDEGPGGYGGGSSYGGGYDSGPGAGFGPGGSYGGRGGYGGAGRYHPYGR